MSIKTNRHATFVHGVLLLGCLAAAAVAAADELQAVVRRSAPVSMADLNLSRPEGMQAARERVNASARRLCQLVSDPLDLSHRANYFACVDATVAAALRQITPPALARDAGRGTAPTH